MVKSAAKAKKTVRSPPSELPEVAPAFAPVVAAFARDPSVTRKRMFSSNAVLAVSGKIFAMHVRGELVVKLPKARVDAIVQAGHGTPFDPGHGRLMKEWIGVSHRTLDWVTLAREARRFVGEKA